MPPGPPTNTKIWKSLRMHCLLHSFGLWKGSCLRLLILGHLNIMLEGTVIEVGQPTWVSANIHWAATGGTSCSTGSSASYALAASVGGLAVVSM